MQKKIKFKKKDQKKRNKNEKFRKAGITFIYSLLMI